jgi:hypothetical protein
MELVESSEKLKISEEDVIDLLDIFTKVPSIILKGVVSGNMNVVKSFETQIIEYKSQLSSEEIKKIRLVLKMPVSELQGILNDSYNITGKKQLKILADPKAGPFIEKNLKEIDEILFPKD